MSQVSQGRRNYGPAKVVISSCWTARAFGRFCCKASAADNRRHPVRCVPGRSGFARLAVKIVNHWNRSEAVTVAQAVRVDDRSCSFRRLRDRRDEDTAAAADQKIAGAGSEAVIFDERPIVRPNREEPFTVGNDARAMAAAERARTRAQRILLRRLRQPKTRMNITAVTSAQMVHKVRVSRSAAPVSTAITG